MKSNRSKNSEKIFLQYVNVNSKPVFLFLLKLQGFLFHKTLNGYTSYLRYFCVTAEHLTCVRGKVVQFSGILGRCDSEESSISSHLHQTSYFLLMNHLIRSLKPFYLHLKPEQHSAFCFSSFCFISSRKASVTSCTFNFLFSRFFMQQAPQTHSVTVENLHLFLFILNKNQTFFFSEFSNSRNSSGGRPGWQS